MKNVQIEFWRFVFAVYMVVYHTLGHVYGTVTGGYIGVDIFAIIAGYFLAVSHEKMEIDGNIGVVSYIKRRFLRLWPMYIIAYLISGFLGGVRSNFSLVQVVERLYLSFPEMFMFKVHTSINGVAWFTAAMLVAGILLYACLTLDTQQKWMPGLILVAALFIYSAFLQTKARIHFILSQGVGPFGVDGFWRVFADMGIGIFAFYVARDAKGQVQGKMIEQLLGILGNACFAVILVVSLFKYHGFSDFWYIFIAWCAVVCLALSERQPIMETRISKAVCYLGGLAYPIYLLHEAVYAMVGAYGGVSSPALGCVAVIGITVLESVFLNWLLRSIKNKLSAIAAGRN